jgi:chromate transporter
MSNLLPGPSSTELAIFIGYRLGGIPGLLIAGACFILPAFFMVWGLAAIYVRYGTLPAVSGMLYGLKPVVLAIVIQALWRLGRSTIRSRRLAIICIAAFAFCIWGISPVLVLLATALIALGLERIGQTKVALSIIPPPLISSIFLVFLKFGCVIFGSGYVLLAFLRSDLVTHRGWLTDRQLLDSVAVGQITPGPVFTTATFIGYLLGGSRGAIAATAGIFAPAFVLVAVTSPFIRRLRQLKWTMPLLDGLNVAAVALMLFVSWQLARTAITDWVTLALLGCSLFVLLRFKPNTIWLIAAAAVLGSAVQYIFPSLQTLHW